MDRKFKKKQVTLTRGSALQRVDEMIVSVEENVRIGLKIEEALKSANDIVAAEIKNANVCGAACYNTVKDCMALNLALTLARRFNSGARRFHPNNSNVASLPLLIRLLKQRRCRSVLIERARNWTPFFPEVADAQAAACERAIDGAIEAYASLRQTHFGRQAAATLKQFWDSKLTRSLMGTILKALPQYRHLFLLMDVARDVTDRAKLAIRGNNLDLKGFEDRRRDEARVFWQPALRAASSATER